MDGGGRLLRSIGARAASILPVPLAADPAFAAAAPFTLARADHPALHVPRPRLPGRLWRRHRRLRSQLSRVACSRVVSTGLALALLASAGGYGLVRGGRYAALVAAEGSLPDILARTAGFGIKAVTITGTRALSEGEVLGLADIGPHRSLLLLDVAEIRSRLKSIPLVKDASVTKLYPDRLLVEIEERAPTALWQKDGAVSIVAADGTPIDAIKDSRYAGLPLVVGEGANTRIEDYAVILEAAGELRDRVRAGIFVAGRRWTLKLDSGIEVALPERNPAVAVARLASLEHDGHILEKDVTGLDLRIPGRVIARLSADAAAARAEALAKKSKKKGAAT